MVTFEIELPDRIYERGIRHAREVGITFSELCSLGVIELMKSSDDELAEMADEFREIEDDRG